MFVEAIHQISKKIALSKNKVKGYNMLENKIMRNPTLKESFRLYTLLSENANKIKESEDYSKLFLVIQKNSNILKSNKIDSEVKKLLEYFNINPKNIKSHIMDKAIKLNEKAIKEIVLNKDRKILIENFRRIIKKKSDDGLRKQFQIVQFLSESIENKKRKTFIQESLNSLLVLRYKNYNSCVKNLFKLRTLTEDVLDGSIEDSEQSKSKYGGGKKVSFKDLNFIKKITVIVPEMYLKPEKIMISFEIPVYPIGATRSAASTSNIQTRNKFNRLERVFVNQFIYNTNRDNLFDPVGTIWDVILSEQATPGKSFKAKFDIYINTNEENEAVNKWEDYYKTVYKILKEFNIQLPNLMGDLKDVLSPVRQKEVLQKAKGLSQEEKEKQANKLGHVKRGLLVKHLHGGNIEDDQMRPDDFGGAF